MLADDPHLTGPAKFLGRPGHPVRGGLGDILLVRMPGEAAVVLDGLLPLVPEDRENRAFGGHMALLSCLDLKRAGRRNDPDTKVTPASLLRSFAFRA